MTAPAGAHPPRGLLVDDEGAADVGAVHPIEHVEVELGQRRERHHTRGVHDHVDTAVRLFRGVEERGDGDLVGDIRAVGDRLAMRRR